MQQKSSSASAIIFFLVGLPGCGKTYWGKQLAAANNFNFIDLDYAIEAVAGITIEEVFSDKGEAFFREMEANTLQNNLQQTITTIIATGGGTPCFFNNMQLMNQLGITIWLNENKDIILQRIKNDEMVRPMFNNIYTKKKLFNLLNERSFFYNQCKHKISFVNQNKLQKIINLYV